MPDTHILRRLPTTRLLLEKLEALHPTGLHGAPRTPDPKAPDRFLPTAAPYMILRPMWHNYADEGWGANRESDVVWTYQVDVMAARGDQLESMRDQVFALFLGKSESGPHLTPLDVDGVKVIDRWLADDTGAEEPVGGIYPSVLRFALSCTKADAP